MPEKEFAFPVEGSGAVRSDTNDLELRLERALAQNRAEFVQAQRETSEQFDAINRALASLANRLAPAAVELATPSVAQTVGGQISDRANPAGGQTSDRAVSEPPAPLRSQDSEFAARQNLYQAAALGTSARVLFGEASPSLPVNQWVETSPFVDQIRWESVPIGFREPRLPVFTGRDDPVSHLQAFEAAVSMRTLTEALRCKLFLTSLGGEARDWFFGLPQKSISSFEDIRRELLLRFATSRKRKSGPAALFMIRQGESETLARFVARFQEEILGIRDVGPALHQAAFISALREGPLKWEVTTREPSSFQELIAIANMHIEGEICNPEYAAYLSNFRQSTSSNSSAPQNFQKPLRQPYQPPTARGRGFRNNRPYNNYQPQPQWQQPAQIQHSAPLLLPAPPVKGKQVFNDSQEAFADLALPISEILEILEKQPNFRRPGPIKSDIRSRNPTLFCDFHKERGHQTENCRALRFLIEKLLKEGKLQDLIDKRIAEQVKRAKPVAEISWECEEVDDAGLFGSLHVGYECIDADDEGENGLLFCIHGGAGLESTKKSSLAKVFRNEVQSASTSVPAPEVVVFSHEDLPPHGNPFNDALVIRAVIENFTVERILVDTGSSVNILFKAAFEALKTGKILLSTEGPLYGFSGEKKEVEGRVALMVVMGKVAKTVEFFIVDAPSSYYAIFGRPILNQYGAVVSTSHLALKFSFQGKQYRVRSDPKLARECYVKIVNFVDIASQLGVEGAVLIPLSS